MTLILVRCANLCSRATGRRNTIRENGRLRDGGVELIWVRSVRFRSRSSATCGTSREVRVATVSWYSSWPEQILPRTTPGGKNKSRRIRESRPCAPPNSASQFACSLDAGAFLSNAATLPSGKQRGRRERQLPPSVGPRRGGKAERAASVPRRTRFATQPAIAP